MISLTVGERVRLLRAGAANASSNPDDLFGARMMLHDALSGLGVDTNAIAAQVFPKCPPITSCHVYRVHRLADVIESNCYDSPDDLIWMTVSTALLTAWTD